MKRIWYRIGLLFVGVVLSINFAFSQNPSFRLQIETGGFMDFKIYSLNRYEGNITYNDWTRLRITYTDTSSGTQFNKWELKFKANTTDFIGSVGNLPLDYVSIEVNDAGGNLGGAIIDNGPHPLSDTYTNLIQGGDEGTFRLSVTYRLDSALLNKSPDYYNTELIFKLDTLP